jgi:molybdate transport system substrate-binding protein
MPEELQNYTGFAVGTPAGAKQSDAVSAFMTYLRTPSAVAAMKAKGMQPS